MSKRKGEEVTLSALASFMGVHRHTATTWVKRGCPYIHRANKANGIDWLFDTAAVVEWKLDQALTDAIGDTAQVDKEELLKRKLAAETTIAEVEAAKKRSEVADLVEIEKQWKDVVIELRSRLRQLPSRVAAQLLGVKKISEIKAIILDEVDESLLALSHEYNDESE